ncbi:MAG: hypothetical protein QXJ25_01910 [Candidatus Aenigmatarchaeota archaeon]
MVFYDEDFVFKMLTRNKKLRRKMIKEVKKIIEKYQYYLMMNEENV